MFDELPILCVIEIEVAQATTVDDIVEFVMKCKCLDVLILNVPTKEIINGLNDKLDNEWNINFKDDLHCLSVKGNILNDEWD